MSFNFFCLKRPHDFAHIDLRCDNLDNLNFLKYFEFLMARLESVYSLKGVQRILEKCRFFPVLKPEGGTMGSPTQVY